MRQCKIRKLQISKLFAFKSTFPCFRCLLSRKPKKEIFSEWKVRKRFQDFEISYHRRQQTLFRNKRNHQVGTKDLSSLNLEFEPKLFSQKWNHPFTKLAEIFFTKVTTSVTIGTDLKIIRCSAVEMRRSLIVGREGSALAQPPQQVKNLPYVS